MADHGDNASDGAIEPDRVEDLPQIDDLDDVPKLPRPPLRKLIRWGDVVRIGMLAALLVGVLVLRKPCADGAANFMRSFEAPDAGAPESPPDAGLELIRITGEETEEELRDKLGRPRPGANPDAGP